MAIFTQLPGALEITFVQGDEVAIALDFDRDLTGYQITTSVYSTEVYSSQPGGAESVEAVGQEVTTFAIQADDLSAGTITIGLSETQTNALSPATAYRWYMRWVDTALFTRTVLSGTLTVVAP